MINKEFVEGRYASWLRQATDFISPKNLFLIAGRGTAKTTDFLAERLIDITYDMPRAMFALVSDTYVNNLTNIVPSLFEGLRERKGWIEGVHYVTDQRPPDHFKLPYKPIVNYKHTISIFNGCFINLGSLDQVSSLAGNSYQHIFGDEAKYLNPEKLKKLMPARRGFPEVAHSVYYRGLTFTTDMPNVVEGDYDWILNHEKNMDLDMIKLALYVGSVLNQIKHEYYKAIESGKPQKELDLIQKNHDRWYERWVRTRIDSTFFHVASSFVNADILQLGYFTDVLKSDGPEEFKASILSLKPELKPGQKFYIALGEHHFYDDGVNNDYYKEKFSLQDKIQETSFALKYLNPELPIEAGMDFGNMLSMVLGQLAGNYYYIFKNMHVLAPHSSKELAKKFIDFFSTHKRKELHLYYDRSGNQYQEIKRDWATEIKNNIENYEGESTGWRVKLMSRNQATIYQEQEYRFAKFLLSNEHKNLPQIRIDALQCKELKSSLKLTKTEIKKDHTGSTRIHKDKSSEKKLTLKQLPMFSTNYSDAFKYLIYRPEWVKYSEAGSDQEWYDPGVY